MKTASNPALEALVSVAADTAMRGAATYFATVKYAVADDAAVCEVVKRHVRAAMPQAILDAQEALDCNMQEVAITTLKASFWVAGIMAAKEVCKL